MINVEEILKDGIIDAQEVVTIKEAIYADGKVDRAEVETLFELKDAAKELCPEFCELVIEATMDCIAEDGIIDSEEMAWITELINKDGEVDSTEQTILDRISQYNNSL